MKHLLRPEWVIVAALFAIAAGVALVLPAGEVMSLPGSDLANQFAPWRAFATASLKAGHFPLWNPYTYSGEPFFGGFQSALLYPLSAVFLILPLSQAINFSFFLHLLILGWGMYRWACQRGFHIVAAVLCGVALPLSGPVWPHIYAGHLSNFCTIAWVPWILAGFERWWLEERWSGLFVASAGIALQIFAGHVQYVYYTGVAAGLQALAWSAARPAVRWRALSSVAACYAAGVALAAVQLLPGLAAASESVRQGKIPFAQAGSLFLPAENLITSFAPGFFGDFFHSVYIGRWYLHEESIFIGAAGLVLVAAAWLGAGPRRTIACDSAVAVLLLLLALGVETPLYRVLYDYAPHFGQFRGVSKFTFPAMTFLVLVIGAGIDRLIRQPPVSRWLSLSSLGVGLIVSVAGLFLWSDPSPIDEFTAWVGRTGEHFRQAGLPARHYHDTALQAGSSLLWAGAVFAVIGVSLAGSRRWPRLRWVPLAIFPVQLVLFAGENFTILPLAEGIPEPARDFIVAHPGDYRILDIINPQGGADTGFLIGAPDIWGNDPMVSRRYAEFITATQGYDPNQASQDMPLGFNRLPRIYAMLRLRYLLGANADRSQIRLADGPPNPMEQVQLISDYRVLHGRDPLLAAMNAPDFDPHRTVLLESEPTPRPVPNPNPGTVRVAQLSTDELTIEADVTTPTLLLITDPYSRDWRAAPLTGSSQQSYTILPANYILRAVPLAAGHHHVLIEYAPPSFPIGIGISLLAFLLWLGVAVGLRLWKRSQESAPER